MKSIISTYFSLWWALLLSWSMMVMVIPIIEAAATPFHPQAIREWISARCGAPQTTSSSSISNEGDEGCSALWSYEGALFDPLNGRKICNVQGIEIIRTLATLPQQRHRQKRLQSYDIHSISNHDNDEEPTMTTLLSRKLFCYHVPGQHQVLDKIKLRPNAPLVSIPKNQAVAVYDSALTISSRSQGKEMLLHTEFPNGKSIWAIAKSPTEGQGESQQLSSSTLSTTKTTTKIKDKENNNNLQSTTTTTTTTKTFDFVVYTRNGLSSHLSPALKQREQQKGNSTTNDDENSIVVAPKRSAWIQFGPSSKQQHGRWGVRETYSYTMSIPSPNDDDDEMDEKNKNNRLNRFLPSIFRRRSKNKNDEENNDLHPASTAARVRYTRYGESPPWYGPGKYCLLELTGTRVDSTQQLAPLAASVAGGMPGFLTVHSPISSDTEAAKAVEWFQESSSPLSSSEMMMHNSNNDDDNKMPPLNKVATISTRLTRAWNRLGGIISIFTK